MTISLYRNTTVQTRSLLMPRIQLRQIAHARSGDKGDDANIGLIALKPEDYPTLVRKVTAERVKKHFAGICRGDVERYELPNLHALNFVLHHALRSEEHTSELQSLTNLVCRLLL